jgi:Tol biopolymer transport system component
MSKKVALALGVTALAAPLGALSASGSRTFDHTYGARWSPAGSRVAFVAFGNGRSPALELATAAGTQPMKLTSGWYVAQAAAWSPRGRKLAFVRMRNVSDPSEASSLWTIDLRTRVKQRLALSSARYDLNSDLAWSPRGSRIAFTLLDEPPNSVAAYRIYTVKATGGSRRLLTWGQRPDWSPDGKTIVFDSRPSPYSTTGVWAVNADGTGARLLAAQAARPTFSPDGTQIAFQRNGDMWSMNADGSDQQRLTDAPEPDVVPRWSPDGRQNRLAAWLLAVSALRDERRRERRGASRPVASIRSGLVAEREDDRLRALRVERLPLVSRGLRERRNVDPG